MLRSLPPLCLVLLLTACAKEREAAPATLDDMVHELFRTWEEPESFTSAADALAAWMVVEGRTDIAWEGLRLTNLTQEDIATVSLVEGEDLSSHVGIANAAASAWPLAQHAPAVTEPDQVWNDPSSFDLYARTILEGNASTFGSGEGLIRTTNDVIKNGALGVTIPYTLRKDYRWTQTSDQRAMFVGRFWIDTPGCSDNGNNCVYQTFGIDVFVEDGDETLRLLTNWLYVVTQADGLLTEDARIGLIATGNQDLILGADAELEARATGE